MVCDGIELEEIVLVSADPSFHDEPDELVSLRVSNDTDASATLDSGTEAIALDERRTVLAGSDVASFAIMERTQIVLDDDDSASVGFC